MWSETERLRQTTDCPDHPDYHSLHFIIAASNALGIGAASFASHAGTGTGIGNRTEFWERGGDGASKDIAESPTAQPERPKGKKDNKSTRQRVYKLLLNKICAYALNVLT